MGAAEPRQPRGPQPKLLLQPHAARLFWVPGGGVCEVRRGAARPPGPAPVRVLSGPGARTTGVPLCACAHVCMCACVHACLLVGDCACASVRAQACGSGCACFFLFPVVVFCESVRACVFADGGPLAFAQPQFFVCCNRCIHPLIPPSLPSPTLRPALKCCRWPPWSTAVCWWCTAAYPAPRTPPLQTSRQCPTGAPSPYCVARAAQRTHCSKTWCVP